LRYSLTAARKREAAGAHTSIVVVWVSLGGDLAIAATKFGCYLFTGATAMLTEAIHSLVDASDQVLLLIGQKRSSRAPDDSHPFGYGMEIYFWSFIVALMVFLAGGAVSVWEGAEKLFHPVAIDHPVVNIVVLAVSAVFEGIAFRVAYREYRRLVERPVVRGRKVGLWRFLVVSKDPNLYTNLIGNAAGLGGLAIAAAGTVAAGWLGIVWADGAASIGIGLLLVWVALFIANETRSLIAGEAAAPVIVDAMRQAMNNSQSESEVLKVASLHLGPQSILVALTVRFKEGLAGADVVRAADDLIARAKAADARVSDVYIRPATAG
jgi:cation diffusion facilitator family transporter